MQFLGWWSDVRVSVNTITLKEYWYWRQLPKENNTPRKRAGFLAELKHWIFSTSFRRSIFSCSRAVWFLSFYFSPADLQHLTINHMTITSWCDSPVNPGVVFPSSGGSIAQQTHSSIVSVQDAKVFTFCASVRRDGPWDKTGVHGQRDRHAAHWKRALIQSNIVMLLGC